MGRVSDHVLALVRTRLKETGPVVWFDADRTYESLLPCLEKEGIPIFRHGGSFIRLRREVDPHMAGFDPPKIVVYVPIDESQTHDALVELTAAGATLRPGHPSYPCNTRLSVVARAALKGAVPDSSLDDIIAKVEDGQLTLSELDMLAERGAPDLSTLSLVYGTAQPDEITLRFLSDISKDENLVAKGGLAEIRRLVSDRYAAEVGEGEDLDVVRTRLANHLLVSDYRLSIQGQRVSGVEELGGPQRTAIRDMCTTWRNRNDLAAAYQGHAEKAEAAADLASLPQAFDALADVDTFATVEESLQRLVSTELRERPSSQLVDVARQRQRTFWGRQPTHHDRWQLIAAAGELVLECERVAAELGDARSATEMAQKYTVRERPWCELDTVQRRLERLYLAFEDLAAYPEIETLVSRARQDYHRVANDLSERFVGALEREGYAVGLPAQREIFAREVKARLEDGRVAFFMIDAMRYEMGRELARLLEGEGDAAVSGAIASIPTITEIGMPSLLPGADADAEIVDVGAGKLALKVDGVVLRNRKERMDYVTQRAGVATAVLKLEDFQPLKKSTRDAIRDAQLIIVTSQEIDMIGEADNSVFARQTMGQVLEMIVRAVRALAKEGVERAVISADHGHLFGEELLADMTIPSPKGDIADLHRRVWVGRGGAMVPNTVRLRPVAFKIAGDFDVVTPRTLACFAAGGGNAFLHGGLSLQELVIPVVTIRGRAAAKAQPGIQWKLDGATRITTRVYTVSVSAEGGLFGAEPQRVRIEVRAGRKPVARVQDADYGLQAETNDVLLEPTPDGQALKANHVTMLIDELGGAPEVEIRLVDARTEDVLARMGPIEVAISL